MFLLRFLRYLRGYVWFEARGDFVERFLNLAARERIAIWQGRKRNGHYSGCVAARDYRHLRKHARKAGVRLHVCGKCGVPFQRRRFSKRAGLVVGLAVFFGFVFGMSRFIWHIEVRGNEKLGEVEILQALENLHITPGALRSGIDVRECERKILLLLPDLSWAALNIDGSTLRVEISERILPPAMVDPAQPCNIVAAEAGQIVAMNVYDGQTMVQIGDTVLPGDIIVSGITQDARGQSLFKHARAEVYAEALQTLEVSVPLNQTEYVETGRVINRGYMRIFGLELPVFLPFRIPSPYRVERSEAPLSFFSIQLPILRQREKYILMEERPLTLTEDEAREEALRELFYLQKARFQDGEILEKNVTGALIDDRYDLTARMLCRMNIALEQKIWIDRGESPEDTGPYQAENRT